MTEDDATTPEDDAASLASLELSPWVAERARLLKDMHFAARRGEREDSLRSKIARWERGETSPR